MQIDLRQVDKQQFGYIMKFEKKKANKTDMCYKWSTVKERYVYTYIVNSSIVNDDQRFDDQVNKIPTRTS